MRKILTLLLSGLSCYLQSQSLSGTLSNAKGIPIPQVTIYSATANKSTNSNVDGTFSIQLSPGKHKVIFQSIDYKKIEQEVEIMDQPVHLHLVMEEQTYLLPELKVSKNNEEPAMLIMRKVISRATYHRRQVLDFTARVYLKGSGRLDFAPWVARGLFKQQEIQQGKTYVTESINEISFKQPRSYRERVISLNSSMPSTFGPEPMRMFRRSWYDEYGSEYVSPLSREAFGVYQFHLLGSFYENGIEINKIEVIPKRKGKDLYKGTLYIVEGLWCLHSCSLKRDESGMEIQIQTVFRSQTEFPFVWLPATHLITVKGNYLGVKGYFNYVAAVSDYRFNLNPNLTHEQVPKPVDNPNGEISNKSTLKKADKNLKKIDLLQKKQELTRREMLELASRIKRDFDRNVQTSEMIKDSSELEIDSLALFRDSNFWTTNRTIPLLEEERQSLLNVDTTINNKLVNKRNSITLSKILVSGDSVVPENGKHYFSYHGILRSPRHNAVEGFGLGQRFAFGNNQPNAWRFNQYMRLYLERNSLSSVSEFSFRFDPLHVGLIKISGGTLITDFNLNGVPVLTDAIQLAFFRQNFSRWFQQDYFQLNLQREITNGLLLTVSGFHGKRYHLENLNRFQNTKAENAIEPNKIDTGEFMPTHRSTQVECIVSYRPYQVYKIRNGRKINTETGWPLFAIGLKHGFDIAPQFTKVEFEISQKQYLRHWLMLTYRIKGIQVNGIKVPMPDWIQFPGNRSFLFLGDPAASFQELPFYNFQMNQGKSLQTFLEFDFKRILLGRLPYLNLFSFHEQLYANLLLREQLPVYAEAGYRISGIMRRISIGINTRMINGSLQHPGIILIIKP